MPQGSTVVRSRRVVTPAGIAPAAAPLDELAILPGALATDLGTLL
jgi:hypothetical protein